MAEFVKERTGKPTPILVLPRGRVNRSTEREPKAVEVYLQIGKKPAGCAICNRPIPPGSSRLQILARFPTEWVNGRPEERAKAPLTTQTYYIHPGCITDRIKPEVVRFAADCYDCGALPPGTETARSWEEHPWRCFTVSKFAPGRLCEGCAKKPRWRLCRTCSVQFPHWMISRVVGRPLVEGSPFSQPPSEGQVDDGTDVCTFCAQRFGLVTEEEAAEQQAQYDQLRKEILQQGVFDAGDE